jgi:two-component system, cell cycle sensor histidine kinase and response regulator CckA
MHAEPPREQLVRELAEARAELARLQRSEEALRRDQRAYAVLAERGPDIITRLDLALRFTYLNAASELVSGVAGDALRGHRPRIFRLPGGARVEAAFRRALASGEPGTVEYDVETPAGRRWYHVQIIPDFDQDGAVESLLTIARDVTELKQAEEARMRSRADFQRLADNAADVITRFDREFRHVYANKALERLLGRPNSELMGQLPRLLQRPDPEGAQWREKFAEVFATGVGTVIEYDVATAEGKRYFQSSLVPELGPDGSVETILNIARDITDLKTAEAALRQREQDFKAVVEHAPDRIGRFDRELRYLYANPALERALGTEVGGAVGRDLFEAPTPRDTLEPVAEKLREALQSGEALVFDASLPSRSGGESYLRIQAVPERNDAGAVESVLVIGHDLTELRELLAEQERLGAIVAASDDAIVSFDREGRTTTWNAGAERLYGFSADEVVGLESSGMMEPESRRGEVRRLAQSVLDGGGPVTIETERLRNDGTTVHVSAQYFGIFDERGALTGAGRIARDITQRVAMEQALRENEARFRELVDELHVGLLVLRAPDWHVEIANRASREQFRLPAGETGQALLDRLSTPVREDGSDLAPGERPVLRAITQRKPVRGVVMGFAERDGTRRWVVMDATPTIGAEGAVTEVICTFSDITARKLAEEATSASEARFRAVVETMPAAIWAWTGRDQLFLNQALIDMSGYSREELSEPGAFDRLFSREDSRMMAERGNARLRGEEAPNRYEVQITRKDGEVRTLEVRAALIELDNGPAALVCAFDVTDRKRAEEERERLDEQVQHTQKLESLGVLVGGIAHDFNNLLVSMLGNAGLALLELPPESPGRQTVLAIEVAAQRAAELTRQMLAYSGRGRFVVEQLNLSRLVEEMAHLLEVAVSRGATVTYHFAPNLPPIEADATQVRQVVMNLITNASDAIGEGDGVISVSTGLLYADREYLSATYLDNDLAEGEYAYLEVSDTGGGMDEQTRGRIFDPFFTTKFTGRGLGLAAVLGIVRGHRGAIEIHSEVGRGTTFKALFPVGEATNATANLPHFETKVSDDGPQRRVLVVDDDETVREVTQRILERMGFAIEQAASGREAVDLYAAHGGEIDLVLLDMTMPHMDGEATFRELRRVDPKVRVLLMSGYSEADATERFSGTGLAGFIQKPFRVPELLGRINDALS